jgi:hypothetical protein
MSGEDDGRLDELQNIDGKLTEKYFFVLQSWVFHSTNKLRQIDRHTATIKWKERKSLKITKKPKDGE